MQNLVCGRGVRRDSDLPFRCERGGYFVLETFSAGAELKGFAILELNGLLIIGFCLSPGHEVS